MFSYVTQRIPGRKGAAAVVAMAWIQDPRRGTWRLFTGNVDGLLVEWDLASLRPLASIDSFGGAIWAIEQQPAASSASPGARYSGAHRSRIIRAWRLCAFRYLPERRRRRFCWMTSCCSML